MKFLLPYREHVPEMDGIPLQAPPLTTDSSHALPEHEPCLKLKKERSKFRKIRKRRLGNGSFSAFSFSSTHKREKERDED